MILASVNTINWFREAELLDIQIWDWRTQQLIMGLVQQKPQPLISWSSCWPYLMTIQNYPVVSLSTMINCLEKVFRIWGIIFYQFLLSVDRATLVELCIQKITDTGTVVTNVVCDNPRVNINMMTALGATLQGAAQNPTLTPVNAAGKQVGQISSFIFSCIFQCHCINVSLWQSSFSNWHIYQ